MPRPISRRHLRPAMTLVLALAVPAAVLAVCTAFPSPVEVTVPFTGGSGSFVTNHNVSCLLGPWEPTASEPWITVSGGSDTGSSTVFYTVAPNPTTAPRMGEVRDLPPSVAPFRIILEAAPVLAVPALGPGGMALLAGALALAAVAFLRRG